MHDVVPLRHTLGTSASHARVRGNSPGAPTSSDGSRVSAVRTLATLFGLLITLPIDALVVAAALVGRARTPTAASPNRFSRTVLITGGKMTKALQLARSFHRAGHRVILTETAKYRFTGHRFSRAVDAFYCVPEPADPDYDDALYEIVRYEAVDNVIPVSSPVASIYDARARYTLDSICEVMHATEDVVRMLDDKAEFSKVAVRLWTSGSGLGADQRSAADSELRLPRGSQLRAEADRVQPRRPTGLHRGCRDERRSAMRHWRTGCRYRRTTLGYSRNSLRAVSTAPTAPAISGRLQVYVLLRVLGIPTQLRDGRQAGDRAWVEQFVGALGVTGQFSFDFIEADDGKVYAIECNPRTHSAITMFHDHPELAAAYLEDGHPRHHAARRGPPDLLDLPRIVAAADPPRPAARDCDGIVRGKDAIFAWWDPLPYLHGSPPPDPRAADRQSAPPRRLAEDRLQHRQAGRAGRRLNAADARPSLLHLVGSAVDEFCADLSRLYAEGCLNSLRRSTDHVMHVAYVSPDGSWRFPQELTLRAIAQRAGHDTRRKRSAKFGGWESTLWSRRCSASPG